MLHPQQVADLQTMSIAAHARSSLLPVGCPFWGYRLDMDCGRETAAVVVETSDDKTRPLAEIKNDVLIYLLGPRKVGRPEIHGAQWSDMDGHL